MTHPADAIWRANLATMAPGTTPYGAIPHGALAVRQTRIAYAGPAADMPADLRGPATVMHDWADHWITPALIDCHTHLVFAANRAEEFEARLRGDSYEHAARRGGGILSTVRATRAAGADALFATAAARLGRLAEEGVRTVEIKSGYGLDLASELKMLRVARRLGAHTSAAGGKLRVRTTLLAAHAVPPEFAGRADDYIDHVIADMLPAVVAEGLADAVDAFAETIAFSPAQVDRLFAASRALGLPVKLHADQLSDGGGAALAAAHGALSADHLEYASDAGVQAMARAGNGCRAAAGCLRHGRCQPATAGRRIPFASRGYVCRHGLQPWVIADGISADGGKSGLRAVPPHAGGGFGRHHAPRCVRTRAAGRSRHARSRQDRGARRMADWPPA